MAGLVQGEQGGLLHGEALQAPSAWLVLILVQSPART